MDQRSTDKAIGYGIIIICYHLIGVFIPILTWLVTGLVIFRIYQEYTKRK
jgi:uncharacterized membrane protein